MLYPLAMGGSLVSVYTSVGDTLAMLLLQCLQVVLSLDLQMIEEELTVAVISGLVSCSG